MIGKRPVVFLVGGAAFAGVIAGCARTETQSASSMSQVRQVAYLKAANPDMGDHFACGGSLPGHSGNALAVSADGNTVAVGAPHESSAARGINGNAGDNSLYASGAVYVFVRRGDTWVQQAYVKASNAGQSDLFGMNVALSADGSTMAVSAPWERSAATGVNGNQNDDSLPQAGAVYVFTRSGDSWSQQAYLKASNTGRRPMDEGDLGADGDQFGFSLALSGDGNTVAVGATTEDSAATGINGDAANDSAMSAGAVYVFARVGNAWSQQAYVKGSNTEQADLFGYDVSLSHDGNTLVAAGYDEDGPGRGVNVDQGNGVNGSGAIYVFSRTGTAWQQNAYLKGSRSEGNDALGFSVAISSDGNTIVAGAGDESCLVGGINPQGCDMDKPADASGGSAGAVYVWGRSGDTWTEQAFIKASNPQLQDWFGVNVAISGDGNTVLVGAPMEDSRARGINGDQQDNSATESGAAYLFTRSGTTWSQQAYMKAENAEAFDEFGTSVAVSGNGGRLLVGARMESGGSAGVAGNQGDNSVPESGAVYVWETTP